MAVDASSPTSTGFGRTDPDALLNLVQPEQNTKLYRSYVSESDTAVSLQRGKSPQQSAFFSRSAKLKEEASLLASLCSLLGVLPRSETVSRQALASISRGEAMCQAFEVCRELVTDPRISFENLVYLVSSLAHGEELTLANCEVCGALTVVDRVAIRTRHCLDCACRDH